jgi:formate dehydrogenase
MGAIDDKAVQRPAADEPATHVGHDAYRADGGYRLLQACLEGRFHPENAIVTLMASGLRLPDRADGALSAGRRWRQVRGGPEPRVLALDVDAGGPWAFQDRHYLGRDPHRILEGALVAAWAAGVERVQLRLPDGERELRAMLRAELARLRADPPGPGLAHVAADNEGAPAATLLEHDAESLLWVRDILERGADWFTSQGRHGKRGLRSFAVSGRVRDPGVKLVPAGTTARELVDEYCGGMRDGAVLYAWLPNGAAGAILPASMADLPLDVDTLKRHGVHAHPGAVCVLGAGERAVDAARDVLAFLGGCGACAAQLAEAQALLASSSGTARLAALAQALRDAACGCGGAAAAQAIDSVLVHFGHELDDGPGAP